MNDRYLKFFSMMIIDVLLVFSLLSQNILANAKASPTPPTKSSTVNEVLLSAASPFEDLTEFALTKNIKGVKQALKAIDEQSASVYRVMPLNPRHDMEILVTKIKDAEKVGNNVLIAQNAVEAYRTLIKSLDINSLKVPIQVSLLDYAGFKLKVLLHVKSPDWPTILENIQGGPAILENN